MSNIAYKDRLIYKLIHVITRKVFKLTLATIQTGNGT